LVSGGASFPFQRAPIIYGLFTSPFSNATSTSSSFSGRKNAPLSFPAMNEAILAQFDSFIPNKGILTFTSPGPGFSESFAESLLITIPTMTPKSFPFSFI
jgi:hypothetical protein